MTVVGQVVNRLLTCGGLVTRPTKRGFLPQLAKPVNYFWFATKSSITAFRKRSGGNNPWDRTKS
jgi:hypothetical protein